MSVLNILFHEEGFSYYIKNVNEKSSEVFHFLVKDSENWEAEVIKELELNLNLRRGFELVKVCFMSSFFNLVPEVYKDETSEVLLGFSEAVFDMNSVLKDRLKTGQMFIYGISEILIDKLNELYETVEYSHSGRVFIDSLIKHEGDTIHINLVGHNIEIAVTIESELVFYNLFDTPTGEDILFYTLFVFEQLGIDTNNATLLTYGELLSDTKVFHIFGKYIRYVKPAVKDEVLQKNYTLYNL